MTKLIAAERANRRRAVFSMAVAACAVIISGFALKALAIPFWWIGLTWTLAGIALAVLAPQPAQFPILMATPVFLALALGELYFAYTGRPEIERTPPAYEADSLLGWKPKPSQVTRATSRFDQTMIFDVTYSIDAQGRRISPPDRGDRADGCVLFFVDSFVFGDGVSDHQTIPYQLGLKTDGRFHIVNLATSGYGAEHMLAIIERGELAAGQPCRPTHILYVALPHHVHRAAGKEWSIRGPRYRLRPSGALEYLGTNPKAEAEAQALRYQALSPLQRRLLEQLSKSRIYRAWTKRPEPTTEPEIELYFAIVRKAYRLFEHRWPQAELHVIGWDIHDFYANGQARFHSGIKTVGAKVHFIDDILPGYTRNPSRYGLHEFDLHPNPMAYEMVAAYLVDRLGLSVRAHAGPQPPVSVLRAP